MKTFIGIVLGLLSGAIIGSAAGVMFTNAASGETSVIPMLAFLAGWAASTYFFLSGATTTSQVFRRGLLTGAAEWLGMIAVFWIAAAKAVDATVAGAAGDAAVEAGAALGGGIFATLGTGFAIMMAVVCMIGFAIAYFAGREAKAAS